MHIANCDHYVSEIAEHESPDGHSAKLSHWRIAAETDYALCRKFADKHQARLPRTLRSQRIGWEGIVGKNFGVLLPNSSLDDDEPRRWHREKDAWRIYIRSSNNIVPLSHAERERFRMLVLPDAAEDWIELLRMATRETLYDIAYDVSPVFMDDSGEPTQDRTGYFVQAVGSAPSACSILRLDACGFGETPESAARDLCRRWLAGPAA